MDNFLKGADKKLMTAVIELLGRDGKALVRVSADGLVLEMNQSAEKLLRVPRMGRFYQTLTPTNRKLLQDAIGKGQPCKFTDHLWSAEVYDVSSVPTKEGALLLILPRKKQTRMDAKLQMTVRESLQGILSGAYLLARVEPFTDQKERREQLYREIVKRSRRIEREIDHVNFLRQAPDRHLPMQLSLRDLAKLCQKAGAAFQERCKAVVEIDVPQSLPAVFDYNMVLGVVMNLLTNAAKAGHVTIRAKHQDASFVIIIEDDGKWITPEEMESLCNGWKELAAPEPLFMQDEMRVRCGLGIPVACLAAALHGGRLTLEERAEGGNRFLFSISDSLDSGEPIQLNYSDDDEDLLVMQRELSVLD